MNQVAHNYQPAEQERKNVITLEPARLPMGKALAEEYGITAPQWRVLVEQIFPNAQSIEAVIMALEYCRARNLDIFKRPVHIVPMWDSGRVKYVETVWPGISEIRTTAHRTGEYAGCDEIEEGPSVTDKFKGRVKINNKWEDSEVTVTYPVWVKCTVYRITKGVRAPYTAKVRWIEAYATIGKGELPNAMWQKRPFGQIGKCAEAAALRMAFPEELGGMYAAEEMEGQVLIGHNGGPSLDEDVKTLTPPPPPPASSSTQAPPPPPAVNSEPTPTSEDDEQAAPPEGDEEPEEIDLEEVDTGEVLLRGEQWANNCQNADDLERWLDEFEPLYPLMGDDLDTLKGLFEAARVRIEGPNVMGA